MAPSRVQRKNAFADRGRLGRERGVKSAEKQQHEDQDSASLIPTSSLQIARAKRIPVNLRVKFRQNG